MYKNICGHTFYNNTKTSPLHISMHCNNQLKLNWIQSLQTRLTNLAEMSLILCILIKRGNIMCKPKRLLYKEWYSKYVIGWNNGVHLILLPTVIFSRNQTFLSNWRWSTCLCAGKIKKQQNFVAKQRDSERRDNNERDRRRLSKFQIRQ